jgi:hypothetical protein
VLAEFHANLMVDRVIDVYQEALHSSCS